MNICHLINSLDPAQGGPPAVIGRMASAQAALGHNVTMIGGRHPERFKVVDDFVNAVPGISRVKVVKLIRPRTVAQKLSSAAYPAAYRENGPFDLVHLHGLWDPALVRTAAACRRDSVPYIVRPAGMLDEWTLGQKATKKQIALRLVHGPMLRAAGAVQALNAHEKRAIEGLGLGMPIEVVPNGLFLDEIELPTQPGEFRAGVPALGDSPFVLFLSRLHHKKGLDILAEAWALVHAKHPSVKLVIAGGDDGDGSIQDFRARVQKHALGDCVVEVGPIYGVRKTAAFRECLCFTLPSRQEGFSVAITEALGLGAPVVVTRDCHFPEVSEVEAGIETGLDAGETAQAICHMIEQPEWRSAAGRRGAELVRSRFTWPAIARQTVALYERLVKKG